MKNAITISLAVLLLSACQHQINFKAANVIKPHLDDAIIEEPVKQESVEVVTQRFVYFDFNSAELNDESKQVLDSHIKAMQMIEAGQIVLQGHTDKVGGEDFNFDLGKKRALSVFVYLVESGINAERLTATSLGKGNSESPNANPTTDRHVEIIY